MYKYIALFSISYWKYGTSNMKEVEEEKRIRCEDENERWSIKMYGKVGADFGVFFYE